MAADLPRLIYIGDLAIEDSHHSSAQLFRLLRAYPADRLLVVETGRRASRIERRLPGVTYAALPIANPRFMRAGARGPYSLLQCAIAPARARRVAPLVEAFRPDSVLTIGSGLGWTLAAVTARRARVPLHFIAHDDWPKLAGVDRWFTGALRQQFGVAYRQARSRLCISPFMIEEFARRYGATGTLLYPVRPEACPAPAGERSGPARDAIVIGYGGGSGAHVMPGLRQLARAVTALDARVIVYGPFDEARQQELRAISTAFEFRGMVSAAEMVSGLRDADILFVPMAFDAASRDNMMVSFPSKLAEYTAVGVPILVHAPHYSSAARWAAMSDAAAVVDADDPAALGTAVHTLKMDGARRRRLADRARAAGASFDLASGRATFEDALR